MSAQSGYYEAQVAGGKDQLDQVLQTQLSLPKILINSDFKNEISIYFDIDSLGQATHLKIEGGQNNVLRNESKRILRFLRFQKTQSLPDVQSYYFNMHLSAEKYNKYIKQKYRFSPKKNLPADSSYVIHTRADQSPEYYKNGEEGLEEFILSEIEYPKVAIEKSIQGTVILEFVVETNGYVTGITVKQAVNAGCSEEAIRLIKLTRWQPAVLNNVFVRYKTTYPITFNLRNVSHDNVSGSSTIGQ